MPRAALDVAAEPSMSADRERWPRPSRGRRGARTPAGGRGSRSRSAEVADLEARLGLDAIRERLLVELAGLGELGVRALARSGAGADRTSAHSRPGSPTEEADDAAAADDDGALEPVPSTRRPTVWSALGSAAAAPPTPGTAGDRCAAATTSSGRPTRSRSRSTPRSGRASRRWRPRSGDLRAAIADTRRLIAELATHDRRPVPDDVRGARGRVRARFQQLFGGGFARLRLTDPDDLASTGVEIVARPPGKKAQALAMLSGGERALTAVALLFAMLEVRPVPFCVLDEVDAALDEANVGRFAEALAIARRPDPVRRHHPQPRHDRGRRRAVRGDRRRGLGQPGHQPAARRGHAIADRAAARARPGRRLTGARSVFWRRRPRDEGTGPRRHDAGRTVAGDAA